MTDTEGPYRQPDRDLRYLCIVCYQTAAATEGTCPRCGGAPLQSIADNGEVIEELRRRAKAKKARPERMLFVTTVVCAAIAAVVVDGILLWRRTYDVSASHAAGYGGRWGAGGELFLYPFLMWLGFSLVFTYVFKWTHLFRRAIADAEKFNPDTADASELLKWLGVSDGRR